MARKKTKITPTIETLEPVSIDLSITGKIYAELLKEEAKNPSILALKQIINTGETFVRQTQRTEVKKFDDSVLKELEEGLGAIERIIANPRTFIKEQAELVQVGLAKRVSSLSIRHFATHSQFVRNINEKNEVVPEKVLTIFAETDTAIYENRFVMTLIKRCLAFIQMRYNYIIEHGETRDSDLLIIHNKTTIDNVTYEVDSRIKVSVPSSDDGNLEKNDELLKKLTELKNRCSTYLASPFMTQMKTAREVTSPIHMTNMIVKQPDYHRCYEFWNFLESYEELGISYDVKETNQHFSHSYLDDINTLIANSISAIHSHRIDDRVYRVNVKKVFRPKITFSLEDQTYEMGKFLYDAYPEAVNRPNPLLPLTSEEVRLNDENLIQRLKNQKDAEEVVRKNIAKRKDEVEFLDAEERKKRANEIFIEYDKLIQEIKFLQQENDELKAEIEKLGKHKK